jgi:hypothetical protein
VLRNWRRKGTKAASRGMRTRRSQGLTETTTTTVPMHMKMVWRKAYIKTGSTESQMSTSLVVRLMMRPVGFVSKKETGARSTEWIMSSCRCCEALTMR